MRARVWVSKLFALVVGLDSTRLGWADVQPGDTITKDNIAQAEALLTPSTRWMVEHGMPMQIITTKKVEWPRAYKEATDKYAKQVKLAADGKELFDYVAGCPFPHIDFNDPLAGYKIMRNYEQKPYDNAGTEYVMEFVNNKGEIEQTIANLWRWMMWTGRLYLGPKPEVSHNPPIHYTQLGGPLNFSDWNNGGYLLSIRYLSPDVSDNIYGYDPPQRHVWSYSTAKRGEPLWGMRIVDYDSHWGFNGKLSLWTFRLLAEKDILAVVHSGRYGDPSVWCAPRDGQHGILAALPCVSWEKRRVWIVEGTPTGYREQYPYSKRVLYIDQEFFGLVVSDLYDQRGEFWKGQIGCYLYTTKPYAGYPLTPIAGGQYRYEDEWPFLPNGVMVDVQQRQAATLEAPSSAKKPLEWLQEWYFNEDGPLNDPQVHSLTYLKSRF